MSTAGEMEKHAAAEVKYTGNSSSEAMRMIEGDKHRQHWKGCSDNGFEAELSPNLSPLIMLLTSGR